MVRLAHEVTASVVAEGRVVTHVAVKVRTATFFTRTRTGKLPEPTTDPAEVAQDGARGARPVRAAAGRCGCWACRCVLAPPDADADRRRAGDVSR